MAPTIGRQWRGGTQDYAALCDYCDVRYLRSQLHRQSSGRLACLGPGTNSCGAGRDEIALDKINADKMRTRRRPTKHLGGRFDHIRTSVEDIFGASLAEYWDADKGVVTDSAGHMTSWTGRKAGAVFLPILSAGGSRARWRASVPEFYGRPAVEITRAGWYSSWAPLVPAGGRPYVAVVARVPPTEVELPLTGVPPDPSGVVALSYDQSDVQARIVLGDDPLLGEYRIGDISTLPVQLPIPRVAVGARSSAYLFELDATGPLSFRVGTAESTTIMEPPTQVPWGTVRLYYVAAYTLVVVANAPTPEQIAMFQSLGRSYAKARP